MKKVRKKTKKNTVADILKTCVLGDTLTDGVRTWKVSQCDEEAIIASPQISPEGEPSFELWNCGVESIAVIPHLKKN